MMAPSEFDELVNDGSEDMEDDEDEEEEAEDNLALLTGHAAIPVEDMADFRDVKAREEPLDMFMRAQDKLGSLWATGMCQIQIYRDYPSVDARGNHISGKICTLNHQIESDWFEKTVGGGTFHAILRGPSKKSPGKPILGAVYHIVIAGKPFVENKHPPDDDPEAEKKGDASTEAMARLLRMQEEQARRQEKHLEQLQVEQKRAVEVALAKAEKESHTTIDVFRQMSEAQKSAAAAVEEKYSTIMDRMFATMNDPSKEAAVRAQVETAHNALRQAAEDHARVLREVTERHRDEISRLREDYMLQISSAKTDGSLYTREQRDTFDARERAMRDEFSRREHDMRESAVAREQTIRDEAERRVQMLTDLASKEEKTLREQLRETKEELRAAKDARERAEHESAEAKYDRIRAEMTASKVTDNPGGMLGLAKSMEEFQAVAALMGLGKSDSSPEPDVMAQVATLLNTEPAKRVGAGIAGLLQGLGQRSAAGAQATAQMAPYVPPPDSALAAWNAAQSQMRTEAIQTTPQAVQRRAVRKASPEYAALKAQVMAQHNTQPMVESTLPEQLISDLEASVPTEQSIPESVEVEVTPEAAADSAATLLQFLDAAIEARKTPAEVLAEVEPFLGGPAAVTLILATPEAEMFARIEEALRVTGKRLSITHKRLLRAVIEVARKRAAV